MPSGQIHDRITLWSLPWLVGGTLLLTRRGDLTLMVASTFLFSGLMFSPDLDLRSRPFKRWGWFRFIWLPYQKFLTHRSWFSHGLIIGTTIRLLYFFSLLFLVAIFGVAIAQLFFGFDWNWQDFAKNIFAWIITHPPETIALFLGLECGAMTHSVADWTHSAYKRYLRTGWQGVVPQRKKPRRRTRKISQRRKTTR